MNNPIGSDSRKGKGFGGLSGLTPSRPEVNEAEAKASSAPSEPESRKPELPAAWQTTESAREPLVKPRSQTKSGTGRAWVVLAILGVIIAGGVIVGISDRDFPTSPTSTYLPPAQPEVSSRPQESKPPVGRNLVFSMAQIRYCLAEDIRMGGAKSALDNYNDYDVDRFNVMVDDYNRRCGSYRYRSSALESARRDVEPYRSQLQSEGTSRFARSPSTISLSAPGLSRPTPDATVQAIQRKLNELGYNAGTADGLVGRGTRSAILAFQRDNGLAADGNPTSALLQLMTMSSKIESREAQPQTPSIAVVQPAYDPHARVSTRQVTTSSTSNGIPQNAHLNYLGNDWECDRGYYKYGDTCGAVKIPQNGKLTYLGNDWECDRGYYKYGNACRAVQIPQNGKLTYLGNDWECKSGYNKYGDACRAVQIPQYGKLTYLGNDWECGRGYYKYGNACHAVQIPQNGKLTYLGNDWECERGYYKYGNACRAVQIPQNGKLTYLGNDWECERGYRKISDNCVPVY